MEGVASEAASLAGHLVWTTLLVYDNNHITIEGRRAWPYGGRRRPLLAYGGTSCEWVTPTTDRIEHALSIFRATKGRPTFIILDSHIGYAPPQAGTSRPTASPL